jgi:hypothetical protein
MRDFVAVFIVFLLVAFALRMATSLQWYKRGQSKIRRTITASGQSIIAEIPGTDGLEFFTEDTRAFHWKKRIIQKEEIRSTRLLISGAPISVRISQLLPDPTPLPPSDFQQSDTIEREHWDVAIDLKNTTVVVECGSIRERVSQELARQVFEAVANDIELREKAQPPERLTTSAQESRNDG